MMTEKDVLRLAIAISRNVKENFEDTHLSGNLSNQISVLANKDGSVSVRIPAVRYDIAKYKKEKTIVYTPEKGSYAQKVNITGGFSKKHVSYVEKAIKEGIIDALGGKKVRKMEFK